MATSLVEDGDFLWRECASWLTRCKIIPPDHNVNSDISLLAKTLRDGVLLCNLLAHLDKNSIDVRDYHKKPQGAQVIQQSMKYNSLSVSCKNILLFLILSFHSVLHINLNSFISAIAIRRARAGCVIIWLANGSVSA